MPKTIDPTYKTKALLEANQPVFLLELELDSGTLYLCDAQENVTFPSGGGGSLYLAQGMSFDRVQNTVDGEIDRVTFTFDNTDLTFRAYTDTDDFQNRRITLKRIFGDLLSSSAYVITLFTGYMRAPKIGELDVMVTADSPLIKLKKTIPARRYQSNCHWTFAGEECNRYAYDTTNLEGHWPLDLKHSDGLTTASDITGTTDGTAANTQLFTSGYYSENDGATIFNGSSDYINMGDVLDLTTGDFTICARIKITTIPVGSNDYFVSKWFNADSANYRFGVTTAGKLVSVIGTSGGSIEDIGDTVLSTGTWYFVCMRWDDASETRVFLDGVSDADTATGNTRNVNNSASLTIGADYNNGVTARFAGNVADVIILSEAMSNANIERLYNLGLPQTGTADSGTTSTMVDAALTEADDYWNYGTVTFSSGNNDGLTRPISDFTAASDTVTFQYPFPNAVAAGDTYTIRRGCNKTSHWCSIKHDNWQNYGGFVGLPQRRR